MKNTVLINKQELGSATTFAVWVGTRRTACLIHDTLETLPHCLSVSDIECASHSGYLIPVTVNTKRFAVVVAIIKHRMEKIEGVLLRSDAFDASYWMHSWMDVEEAVGEELELA